MMKNFLKIILTFFVLLVLSAPVSAASYTLNFELGYTGAGDGTDGRSGEAEFNDSRDQTHASIRSLQDTQEYGGLLWEGSADNYGFSSGNWLDGTVQTSDKTYLITQSEARADYLYGTYVDKTGSEFAVGGPAAFLNVKRSDSSDFILDGAWFSGIKATSGAWLSASSVTIKGYKDGLETGFVTLDLSIDAWAFLDATSLGVIDLFVIENGTPMSSPYSGGDAAAFYRFDDMSYRTVPIPGAIWLLGSGFFGLVGWRRRQKK